MDVLIELLNIDRKTFLSQRGLLTIYNVHVNINVQSFKGIIYLYIQNIFKKIYTRLHYRIHFLRVKNLNLIIKFLMIEIIIIFLFNIKGIIILCAIYYVLDV